MKMLNSQESTLVVGGLSDSNKQSLGRMRYFLSVLGPSLTSMGGAMIELGETKSRPKSEDKEGSQPGA